MNGKDVATYDESSNKKYLILFVIFTCYRFIYLVAQSMLASDVNDSSTKQTLEAMTWGRRGRNDALIVERSCGLHSPRE